MRRCVLHLGDPGVTVGRALPVGVRQRLALALPVEARQVLGARRIDAALFRHPRQHRAIALAAVAPHDRAQSGVGFHRRAVDADPLALHQAALGHELQHPAEHRLVRLVRQTRARARQPRMIGHLVAVRQPQEIAQRERVRATPRDAPLAVDGPRSSRSCACGNTVPAEATARPSAARNTACTPLTTNASNPASRSRSCKRWSTRAPASAASPATSPSDHPEQPLIAPSPSLIPVMPPRQRGIGGTELRQRADNPRRRGAAPVATSTQVIRKVEGRGP